jgi:hypothetical protein
MLFAPSSEFVMLFRFGGSLRNFLTILSQRFRFGDSVDLAFWDRNLDTIVDLDDGVRSFPGIEACNVALDLAAASQLNDISRSVRRHRANAAKRNELSQERKAAHGMSNQPIVAETWGSAIKPILNIPDRWRVRKLVDFAALSDSFQNRASEYR